jgi:1,4-dihydroxy-2-naphthoyl-CoA synthase
MAEVHLAQPRVDARRSEARGLEPALARVLAAKSPQLMRRGKAAFVRGIDTGYRQGVSGAVDLLAVVLPLEDSREALAAFAERRRPTWRDGGPGRRRSRWSSAPGSCLPSCGYRCSCRGSASASRS